MIEAHHIEKRERATEALDPPLVSAGRQQVPAINRIPPKLSGGAEIIRRHAGDYGGTALIVEIEQLGMSPDVRAVVRNIDRDVTHETDAALLAIGLETLPLLEEFELPILEGLQFGRQFFRPLAHRMRVSFAYLRIPGGPHCAVVRIFAGHEERVVVEPRTGALAKAVEGRTIGAGTVGKENLRRPAQSRHLEFDHRSIVDEVFGKRRRLSQSQVRLFEQALIAQAFKTEQHRIAGKSGEALIRGIGVSGGIQRQHLPQLLSRSRKEVGEFVGAGAKVTDAEAPGQRGEVQQNATTSRKFHSATIRRLAA